MGEKYQMENPSDARVFIDYNNKEVPVRFEYPDKKSAFNITFKFFLRHWIRLNYILIIFAFFIFLIVFAINNPQDYSSMQRTLTLKQFILAILVPYYFVGIPLTISIIFIKNKRLLSLMPYLWAISSKIYMKGYYSQKIYKIDSKVFEIPMFENVFLDYNATGEFSKYLKKVNITEHPLDYCKKNISGKTKNKHRQTSYWKAKFIFSGIPKNGFLEVKFI